LQGTNSVQNTLRDSLLHS